MEQALVQAACAALTGGPRHAVHNALAVVPSAPGLYAVYGDSLGVTHLATGTPGRPLYVGKAERSLVGRDLKTHFATSKTGSSTLRRTVAALLRERLQLVAVPRKLAKPDGSANYSLEPDGDERLTRWMVEHLKLAVWLSPADVVLDDVETAVLAVLVPPLNISKMGSRADSRVKAARAVMAAESRAWRP